MTDVKALQFELWTECNQQCDFCYLGKSNIKTLDEKKLQTLQRVIDMTTNPEIMKNYNNISFIGGEFFQGQLKNPEVRKKFFEVFQIVENKLHNNEIYSSWITATLTNKTQDGLWDVLELLKPYNDIWITTSYDTKGRFHTPQQEQNWKDNILKIHKLYPNVHINVTSILTHDLITKFINGEFSFNKLITELDVSLYLKQIYTGRNGEFDYCNSLEDITKAYVTALQKYKESEIDFFPKRSDFLKFMNKFYQECPQYFNKLMNIEYRADLCMKSEKDQLNNDVDKRNKNEEGGYESSYVPINPKCGHAYSYAAYKDSDKCMLCDKFMFMKQVGIM